MVITLSSIFTTQHTLGMLNDIR